MVYNEFYFLWKKQRSVFEVSSAANVKCRGLLGNVFVW